MLEQFKLKFPCISITIGGTKSKVEDIDNANGNEKVVKTTGDKTPYIGSKIMDGYNDTVRKSTIWSSIRGNPRNRRNQIRLSTKIENIRKLEGKGIRVEKIRIKKLPARRKKLDEKSRLDRFNTEIAYQKVKDLQNFVRKRNHSNKIILLTKKQLMDHFTAIKDGNNTNKCDICENSFTKKEKFEMHVLAVHEGKKPNACNSCHAPTKEAHIPSWD